MIKVLRRIRYAIFHRRLEAELAEEIDRMPPSVLKPARY